MAFNTSRVEALELQNLFEVAEATAIASSKNMKVEEPMLEMISLDRDDENWLCHSLYDPSKKLSEKRCKFCSYQVDAFPPIVRTY